MRKFGTPLLTASTPVSAVHPEAKERRHHRQSASPVSWSPWVAIGQDADSATGGWPGAARTSPTTIIANTATTNP